MSDVALEQQEFALPYAPPKEIISIIQAVVIVTNGGESTASSSEIANTADISKETISLNLPFLIGSGLVKVIESGKYKPSDGTVRFARQLGWDELEAKKLLRQSISEAWYCKLISKRFQERSVQTAIQLIELLQQDLPISARSSLDSFERIYFDKTRLLPPALNKLGEFTDFSKNYDEFVRYVKEFYKQLDDIGDISRENKFLIAFYSFQKSVSSLHRIKDKISNQFLLDNDNDFVDWLAYRSFYSKKQFDLYITQADPAAETITNLIGWLIYVGVVLWVNEFEIVAGDLSDIAPSTLQAVFPSDIVQTLNSSQNLTISGSQVHIENLISGDTKTHPINISLAINFPIHSWDDLTEANAKRIRDWLKLLVQPDSMSVDQ